MQGRKQKMPPKRVVCPACGKKKLFLNMLRTTHDGRVCEACGHAAITCHWCYDIVCDWQRGEPNTELKYMPHICPACHTILICRS